MKKYEKNAVEPRFCRCLTQCLKLFLVLRLRSYHKKSI